MVFQEYGFMPLQDVITTEFVGPEVRKDWLKEINSIMDRHLSWIAHQHVKLNAQVQVPVQGRIFPFQFYNQPTEGIALISKYSMTENAQYLLMLQNMLRPLWARWQHVRLSRSGQGFDPRSGQVSWVRFFRGFSSPIRQTSGSFRPPRYPDIIWPSLSSIIIHYGRQFQIPES